MSEKPIREYDRFIVRLPDGMRERIALRAKANGRSMNSEVVAMLYAMTRNTEEYQLQQAIITLLMTDAKMDRLRKQVESMESDRNRLVENVKALEAVVRRKHQEAGDDQLPSLEEMIEKTADDLDRLDKEAYERGEDLIP